MLHSRRLHFVLPAIAAALLTTTALVQSAGAQTAPVQKAAATPAKTAVPALVPVTVVKEADRYETALKAAFKPGKQVARDLIATGQKATTATPPNPRAAVAAYREAVFTEPTNAQAWTLLADALLQVQPDPTKSNEKSELLMAASAAAWRATERAQGATEKSRALFVLSEAMKRRALWRPAINVLKAALAVDENPIRRANLNALIAEHGFRILETKTDADAVNPRACVQFSETLASGKIDFASFVTVDGRAAQAVTAEARQLCVDGLKHGQRYQIQVRAGLPSAISETLIKNVDLNVYVRDRAPSVRAAGRAYVLPRSGQQGIPLTTVNTETVKVDVFRIGDRNLASALQSGEFQKQISSYDIEQIKEKSGHSVYSGELVTVSRLNEDVTTAFPVSDAIPKLQSGVYVLSAKVAAKSGGDHDNDNRHRASQWFIVSDLGMTAFNGRDGVHGFVRSLATAEPVAGAKVRLVARNNEILGEAKTDARGYVKFDGGLKRGEGGLAPAFLSAEIAAGDSGDFAFLDLSTAAFDLSDRGVKGRDAPGPLDAFTFADRGVYRPGETVFLTSLIRDAHGKAAKLPVTLIVSRPDGVEHKRIALTDDQLGARAYSLVLGGGAQTGTWRVKIHADPKSEALSSAAFLVEDFVPERLDLKLEAATATLEPETGGKVKLTSKYLYGPPAANLAVEADIVVKPSDKGLAAYPGYRFGLADEKIAPARKTLEGLPETDATGLATLPITLPQIDRTARPLEANVIVRLRESGGRTIERSLTMPVGTSGPRVGIKPLFGTPGVAQLQTGEGESVAFETLLIDAKSAPIPIKGLKWELFKLEQRWQWYNRDNEWTYDAQTSTRRVASGEVATQGTSPAKLDAKTEWGRYRLEVSVIDPNGAGVSTPILSSIEFTSGYWHDEAADSPEMLDIALDKPSYKAGDTARVRITSKMAGKAQIAILGSGVIAMQEANLPAGGGEVAIPVTDAWGAGAYVTATLFRPLEVAEKRMPGRAMGLKWLTVDADARKLSVTLDAPEKVKGASKLTVPVKLVGLTPGEAARVTVHATDAGILNLTRFETPKPDAWFFGQRKLGLEIRDFYARLIDGMRAERGKLRSGGDGGADNAMSMTGAPPVEATLALTSGIVTVGPDGTAQVSFDLPDFNGTVRLTAVAWSEGRAGSTSKDVIVRDAVTLTASAPRFLTLGDEARLQLDIHNVEGAAGTYDVAVTNGAQSLAGKAIALKAGEKKADTIALKPTDVGPMALDVSVKGPGGISVTRKLSFDVKPPAGDIKRTTVATLNPKGGKLVLSADLLADLIPSTAKITAHVGPLASLNVPGLLAELDRYPYGCAEQTTSRALPLLYANDVARQIGLGADKDLRDRVAKAIEHVLEMQDSAGAFGVWGPSHGDLWLTSYVTDFLLRARESGHAVSAKPLSLALDKLANSIAIEQDFTKGGENRAYALYVLARAGRAPVGELRYDVDTRLEKFSTALSQAQLGAALGLTGDRERAEKAFAAAIKKLDVATPEAIFRRDYGTGLRDGAALVTLASELKLAKTETPRLVDVLAKAHAAKAYTSTQEQAWLLLAARAIADQGTSLSLTVNGTAQQGQFTRAFKSADLKDGAVTIENTADAATNAVITVLGSALTPEPAVSKGFTLERTYYTLDGKKLDLKSASGGTSSLPQNERLVVVLKVDAQSEGGRILLVDRLPAGFEIENPRIVDSGDVKSLDWLTTTRKPEHTEFRDDRFVAAFDFFGSDGRRRNGDDDAENKQPAKTATVAYLVRAVTPGSFIHPAATVEDMYRPDRHARTATGKLTVTSK